MKRVQLHTFAPKRLPREAPLKYLIPPPVEMDKPIELLLSEEDLPEDVQDGFTWDADALED